MQTMKSLPAGAPRPREGRLRKFKSRRIQRAQLTSSILVEYGRPFSSNFVITAGPR
jgi:hypothetical protein